MPDFFPLIGRILLAGLLLSSCSHSSPTAIADASVDTAASVVPAKRTPGTKVDSLNGIPGHHFGEPLSAFPGLKQGESNVEGMKRYYYPFGQANQGYGWFGKHAQQLRTNYYFFNNKFALFMASAYGDNRNPLSQEIVYLFGMGDQFQLNGTIWQGEKVRVVYTQPFSTEGPATQLEVVSVSLEAQQKQQATARLKAENNEK